MEINEEDKILDSPYSIYSSHGPRTNEILPSLKNEESDAQLSEYHSFEELPSENIATIHEIQDTRPKKFLKGTMDACYDRSSRNSKHWKKISNLFLGVRYLRNPDVMSIHSRVGE